VIQPAVFGSPSFTPRRELVFQLAPPSADAYTVMTFFGPRPKPTWTTPGANNVPGGATVPAKPAFAEKAASG